MIDTEFFSHSQSTPATAGRKLVSRGIMAEGTSLQRIKSTPYLTLRQSQADPMLRSFGLLNNDEDLKKIVDTAQETGDFDLFWSISAFFPITTDMTSERGVEVGLDGRNVPLLFSPQYVDAGRQFRSPRREVTFHDWKVNSIKVKLAHEPQDNVIRQLVEEVSQYSFHLKTRVVGKVAEKKVDAETRLEMKQKLDELEDLVHLFNKETSFLVFLLHLYYSKQVRFTVPQLLHLNQVRRKLRLHQDHIKAFYRNTELQDRIKKFL